MKKVEQKTKGFTIIEVLIVLAIAGLIMVVVFLAVPSLQRAGRNNALNTNANNIFTGVNSYLSNNNGTLPTTASLASGVVTISGPANSNSETIRVDSSIASAAVDNGAVGTALTNSSAVGSVEIITGINAKCNATASGLTIGGGTARSVAVLFVVESGSGNILKCLN